MGKIDVTNLLPTRYQLLPTQKLGNICIFCTKIRNFSKKWSKSGLKVGLKGSIFDFLQFCVP